MPCPMGMSADLYYQVAIPVTPKSRSMENANLGHLWFHVSLGDWVDNYCYWP